VPYHARWPRTFPAHSRYDENSNTPRASECRRLSSTTEAGPVPVWPNGHDDFAMRPDTSMQVYTRFDQIQIILERTVTCSTQCQSVLSLANRKTTIKVAIIPSAGVSLVLDTSVKDPTVLPAFDGHRQTSCQWHPCASRPAILRPAGAERTHRHSSTSSVRLRRTAPVATTVGPSGAAGLGGMGKYSCPCELCWG